MSPDDYEKTTTFTHQSVGQTSPQGKAVVAHGRLTTKQIIDCRDEARRESAKSVADSLQATELPLNRRPNI